MFPGNDDLVHGRYVHRPEVYDVDLFRIEVSESGVLVAETIAQRLAETSLLDTVVTVYRQEIDGTRTEIARNDDYFGEDSFVELPVGPGVYYVGVWAGGNRHVDPAIEDTGFGGVSQGEYEVQIEFRQGRGRVVA